MRMANGIYSDLEELLMDGGTNVIDRALQTVDVFVKTSGHDIVNRHVVQARSELAEQALRLATVGADRRAHHGVQALLRLPDAIRDGAREILIEEQELRHV